MPDHRDLIEYECLPKTLTFNQLGLTFPTWKGPGLIFNACKNPKTERGTGRPE